MMQQPEASGGQVAFRPPADRGKSVNRKRVVLSVIVTGFVLMFLVGAAGTVWALLRPARASRPDDTLVTSAGALLTPAFTPVPDTRYVVRGTLSKTYSAVWIETAGGRIVGEKIEKRAPAES